MRILKRITALLLALVVCMGLYSTNVVADSKSDLEDRLAQIEQRQKQLSNEIAIVRSDKSQQQKYQDSVWEQIELTMENIELLKENVEALEAEIALLEEDIVSLEADIAQKQTEYDDGNEVFKQRVRALYIAGDDSMLSILLGSTDFYSMLSNAEYIKRITIHDKEILDGLVADKQALEITKLEIEDKKLEVEDNKLNIEQDKLAAEDKKKQLSASYSDYEASVKALEKDEAELLASYSKNKAQYDEVEKEIQRIIDEEKRKQQEFAFSGGAFAWPVPGHYRISSYYGWRTLFGQSDWHTGIDIVGKSSGVIKSAPIVAANSGKVLVAEKNSNRGYGHYVLIDHGYNSDGVSIYTLYGHCDKVIVNVGDTVDRGQQIATVGTTGLSTGYHVHFEIRLDNQKVDPYTYAYKSLFE